MQKLGEYFPKSFLPVDDGEVLLSRLIKQCLSLTSDIHIVIGHRFFLMENFLQSRFPEVKRHYNKHYAEYSNAYSLECALREMEIDAETELMILDADSYISSQAFAEIKKDYQQFSGQNLIFTTSIKRSIGEWNIEADSNSIVRHIDTNITGQCHDVTVGCLKFNPIMAQKLKDEIGRYRIRDYWDYFYMDNLSTMELRNCNVHGNIYEIDSLSDIDLLWEGIFFCHKNNLSH